MSREVLAEQPAHQKPVAWRYLTQYESGASIWTYCADEPANREIRQPLYTSPQPSQQDPVAWVCYGWSSDQKHAIDCEQHEIDAIPVGTLLYASPQPSKPWMGLTDDEIEQMGLSNYIKVVREIEAKLREKNT